VNIEVDESDLLKIQDALIANSEFHRARDKMNSMLHLARDVRWSPITSETMAAEDRIRQILSVLDSVRKAKSI
jgi:hypothetical protein